MTSSSQPDSRRTQQPPLYRHACSPSTRTMLFGILTLAGAIALYTLAVRYSYRFDMTQSQRYTLTAESIRVLQHLRQPVHVIGFFQRQTRERATFSHLLRLYRYHTTQLTSDLIDPKKRPELAQRHNITTGNAVVVIGYGHATHLARLDEETLTNALAHLARTTQHVIYFVTGHGEPSLTDTESNGYSHATEQLQKHYTVQEFFLPQAQRVPSDAAAVIVAGPQYDLSPVERQTLHAFLARGGHLLLLLDPNTAPGFRSFLQRYGLELGNDIVIETNALGRLFGGDYHMPAITTYGQHPITQGFQALMTIFPVARSVRVAQHLPTDIRAQTLAFTSPHSWAETDLQALQAGRSVFDAQHDRQGPISIAAVATMQPQAIAARQARMPSPPAGDEKRSLTRIVVFGDSEFANNQFFHLQGNGDLFLRTISWLVEEDLHIAIRPPIARRYGPVTLSATQQRLTFWVPVVLLPAAVLVGGLVVLRKRRQQQRGGNRP